MYLWYFLGVNMPIIIVKSNKEVRLVFMMEGTIKGCPYLVLVDSTRPLPAFSSSHIKLSLSERS